MCTNISSCVGCVTEGPDNDVTCTLFSSITGTSEQVGATAYYIENRGTKAYNRFEYQCLPKHSVVDQRILFPDLRDSLIYDFVRKMSIYRYWSTGKRNTGRRVVKGARRRHHCVLHRCGNWRWSYRHLYHFHPAQGNEVNWNLFFLVRFAAQSIKPNLFLLHFLF